MSNCLSLFALFSVAALIIQGLKLKIRSTIKSHVVCLQKEVRCHASKKTENNGLKEPKSLPSVSKEQKDVIDAIINGNTNVILDSVAGSGKTTTILHLAIACQPLGKSILHLTYNARLKDETKIKVKALNIKKLDVFTYHGLCKKYYNAGCINNNGMISVTAGNWEQREAIPHYDIIVVDEAQDMVPLYFQFVCKVLHDIGQRQLAISSKQPMFPKVLLTGDKNQELYTFKDADSRYLSLADKLYTTAYINNNHWTRKILQTSYRVSGNIAKFVNEVMLGGEQRLLANRDPGEMVDYYVGDPWTNVRIIAEELINLIKSGKINYEDLFILAASVKASEIKDENGVKMRPIQLLENLFVEAKIPAYVSSSDDAELKKELIKGKVVFSSFHQAKGLERKIVVCFDFSASYFRFYGKELSKFHCPNTLYVAATRARDKLIIIGEQYREEHLPFISIQNLKELGVPGKNQIINILCPTKVWYQSKSGKNESVDDHTPKDKLTVTELIGYLSDSVLSSVESLLAKYWVQLQRPVKASTLKLPDFVEGNMTMEGNKESVIDINGIAIPALLEIKSKKSSTIYNELLRQSKEWTLDNMDVAITSNFKTLQNPATVTSDQLTSYSLLLSTLHISAAKLSTKKAYVSKIKQILQFDWIPDDVMNEGVKRLEERVLGEFKSTPDDLSFEVPLNRLLHERPDGTKLALAGRADIVTPSFLFELKCVTKLLDEHKLQLALYAWMWSEPGMKYRLYNVKTNEMWEFDPMIDIMESLNTAVKTLVDHYLTKDLVKKLTDDKFINKAIKSTKLYHKIDQNQIDQTEVISERNKSDIATEVIKKPRKSRAKASKVSSES